MTDASFPAHVTVDSETDLDGLPVLTATVTTDPETAALPLPDGDDGLTGDRGAPRAPFAKMGAIADEAARPTGLGADDRGKWWHRLDDDGLDYWTGTAWVHSAGAVGEQGPVAPAATVTTTTVHDAALTTPAVKVTGPGPALQVTVTAPAGLQGAQGASGASGSISAATDFDDSVGPTQGSVFAYLAGSRRWRVLPPPVGLGPWAWRGTDFAADAEQATDKLIAGTLSLPPMPFRYRPVVFGRASIYASSTNITPVAYVRLGNSNGVMVATGAGNRISGNYCPVPLVPAYGDEGTKSLSPVSDYATVPAYQATALVATVERVGSSTSSGTIGYTQAYWNLVCWAIPA